MEMRQRRRTENRGEEKEGLGGIGRQRGNREINLEDQRSFTTPLLRIDRRKGMTARDDIRTTPTERMKCHEGRKIEGLLIACEWKQPGADIKVSQKQVHDLVDEIGIPTVWLSRRVLSR
ncbi:uncharacterized protein LOC143899987 [Temnothorax americanus]|uniref:uncharacterized protein LOC143899987 n=1 Tax=Temnothorax americanus TaxID=1964332 RepID=UPI0040686EAD